MDETARAQACFEAVSTAIAYFHFIQHRQPMKIANGTV